MKYYLQKYKVTSFYILVLIISGLLLTIQSNILWATEYSLSLPQLAPTLAVLIICFLSKDKKRLIQIYKHTPLVRKGIIWIPITLGLTILAVTLTAGILTCLGFPYIKWNGTVLNVIIMLCGFFWGLWHMSFNLGLFGFLIFIVTAIEMSLLMTWIYHKTNGNLILMTLWHFSSNVLNQIFLTERLTALGFGIFGGINYDRL